MSIDAETLKKRIAVLPKIANKRQYTAAVKKDVIEYVVARISEGTSESAACQELELHQATVTGWRRGPKRKNDNGRSRGSIRPVEVAASVKSRALVLVLPGGARVEGLDVSDVAELARSLT
jgi:hypothetical protein